MSNYKVYAHINHENGKAYIGITMREPNVRWGKDGCGYKNQPKFYNAIKKYGWSNFEHIILAEVDSEEEALELETSYIQTYNSIENGYNILERGIESYPREIPVICLNTNEIYSSIKEAAITCDVTPICIIDNYNGKNSGTKGLKWAKWDKENSKIIPPIPYTPKKRVYSGTEVYCLELQQFFPTVAETCRRLGLEQRALEAALSGTRNGCHDMHFIRVKDIPNTNLLELLKRPTGKSEKIYCYETNQVFLSFAEAEPVAGVKSQSIMKNCQGKTKSCNGKHFSYLRNLDNTIICKLYGLREDGSLILRNERYQGEQEEEEN